MSLCNFSQVSDSPLIAHMLTDYYSHIEQKRGPQPSEQMIASIAQGLHLSLHERDHHCVGICTGSIIAKVLGG